ncbi:NYN domain-containing protein [Candidatus Poribacteria bacterium]|nr:NYN domain-containing protein [Candidatus Poribacteria bacterium]
MPRHKREKVALFIDTKNYIKPFQNLQEKMVEKLGWIQNLASEHGQVVIKRAYADFTHKDVPGWLPRLFTALGIQCIFTPCYGGGEKDMDDQIMVLDITTLPFLHPEITTIFVVTGDGHIVPALNFYRSTGRKAIGISSNGTSAVLKDYASDGFYQLEIEENQQSADDNKLLRRIKELVQTKDYGKDGLLDALSKENGQSRENIERQIAWCLRQGVLSYEQTVYNGHPIKVLRFNPNASPVA